MGTFRGLPSLFVVLREGGGAIQNFHEDPSGSAGTRSQSDHLVVLNITVLATARDVVNKYRSS